MPPSLWAWSPARDCETRSLVSWRLTGSEGPPVTAGRGGLVPATSCTDKLQFSGESVELARPLPPVKAQALQVARPRKCCAPTPSTATREVFFGVTDSIRRCRFSLRSDRVIPPKVLIS